MKRASIDIGSNSVLLLVADFHEQRIKEIVRESRITSLGKDLDKNGEFHQNSMDATFEALKEYASICSQHQIKAENIIVTATEASRVAKNAPPFFEKIKTDLGLSIQIITSKAEAELTTLGILQGTQLKEEQALILDIGGASTELIKVNPKNHQILESISMPAGSVRSTDWLLQDLFLSHLQKIFTDFSFELDRFSGTHIYSVAGTMTSLGNMHLKRKDFIEDDVHGLVLTMENIDNLFKNYSTWNPDQFLAEFPFLGKRSMSIKGGLHLVYHLFHRTKTQKTTISTYGLRYGSLFQGEIKSEQLF